MGWRVIRSPSSGLNNFVRLLWHMSTRADVLTSHIVVLLVSLGSQCIVASPLLSYNRTMLSFLSMSHFLVAIPLGLIVHLLSSLIRTCLCCQICPSPLFFSHFSLSNASSCMFPLDSPMLNYFDISFFRNKCASICGFKVLERTEG